MRDSSGVQIVSNPSAVTGDTACPVVDSIPAFTIGGAEAQGPYDIGRVRGVRRLRDGAVVVLNRATSELRFFDAAGHYLRSVGRKGSGPGEFQSPYRLLWYGPDTVMVQDLGTSRITTLGVDGTLYRDVPTPSRMVGPLLGRLPDGTFLAMAVRFDMPGLGASGRQRLPVQLLRLSGDGVVLDTLGSFPGDETVTSIGEYGASMMRSATFGRATISAMADSLVYVGDNDAYRVQVFAGGRRLVRIIEKTHPAVPVTAAMVDSEKARRARAASSPQSRTIDDRLSALDRLPETLPAFRTIALDADGWLWVRGYSTAREGKVTWDVFDAGGRLRCAVALPAALEPHEIGHDFLLGVHTDPDGLEQLRLYGVRRGGHASN